MKTKNYIWFPIIGFLFFAGIFFINTQKTYAAAIMYAEKITNTAAYNVYTTFGATPVYTLYVTNQGNATGSVTGLAVTPSSTTINDTNVTLSFFKDANANGYIDNGDTNLGGSGAFSANDTKTTFNFVTSVDVPSSYPNFTYILILANGTGVNGNTFTASIAAITDVLVIDNDNICSLTGSIGANANALTLTSTAPSMTAGNGTANPSAVYIGPNSTNGEVQQIKFVNAATTHEVISSIQITPGGTVEENSDYTVEIWLESDSGTMGTIDSADTQLKLASGAWLNNSNGATTFTITGGLQVAGSSTVNIIVGLEGNGTATVGETHSHSVSVLGISAASGNAVSIIGGQSSPFSSATGTVEATAPTIVGVYSGGPGIVDVQFSESIDDSSFTPALFVLDLDAVNSGGEDEVAPTGGQTTIVAPSADSDSNDEYYRMTNGSNLPSTGGLIYLHNTGSGIKDLAGNSLAVCAGCGTEYDASAPTIATVGGFTRNTDASGRNRVILTMNENIYLDNTNQDGTLDSGDTTSTESITSTASFGGLGTAGIIENIGTYSVTGDIAQNAEACNTLSVSTTALTITFNTQAECFFTTGTTWPGGGMMFQFRLDNGVTKNNYLYATQGYNLASKQFALNSTVMIMGGDPDNWDKTAPSTVTAGTATSTSTTITPTWTAITDTYFGEYIIAYRTTTGVTMSNGTLWSSADDANLATASRTSTTISNLSALTTYYYVVYARDAAGNLSIASTEKTVTTTSSASAVSSSRIPSPNAPTNVQISLINEGVKLTWTDPVDTGTDNVLDKIVILKGENELPVSGELYASINKGVQEYIDTNVKDGNLVKYILRAKNKKNKYSNNSSEVSIIVKLDTTPPTVSKIEATDRTELVVTFTENVDPTSAKIETFSVKDDQGNKLELKSLTVSGDKVTLITAPQTLGKIYTLKVPTFENLVDPILDLSGNAMSALYTGTFAGVPVAEFTDVTLAEHGWAMEAINWARTLGYVSGRSKGIFAPGAKVVRSELAAMLAKVMLPEGNKDLLPDGKSSFQDTLPEMWDTPYINYLYVHEITKGRQPGFFVPAGYTYRAEMVSMLVKWLETLDKFKVKASEITTEVGLGMWENPYADTEKDTWYERTMAIATYYGIIEGKDTDGKKYASPLGKISRAESVVMLERAFNLLSK